MGAQYYFGIRSGKSKSSGNDYWMLQILRMNRFKSYEISQCFVDEDTYGLINSKGFPLGAPITVTGDPVDGQITDIHADPAYAALNLNQRSKEPVQYATKGG